MAAGLLLYLLAVRPFLRRRSTIGWVGAMVAAAFAVHGFVAAAFVRQSYDQSIALVSKLTPAQMERSYTGFGAPMTGLEILMFVLDHSTHHRASAEMYLRAKGIAPAEYEF